MSGNGEQRKQERDILLSPPANMELTAAQRARMEANRKRALELQAAKRTQDEKFAVSTNEHSQELSSHDIKINISGLKCSFVNPITGVSCYSEPIVQEIYDAFGESCCKTCRSESDDYDLLSKSEVASQYMLPVDTVKMMKFTEKSNPINPLFAPMKLYLRKHARDRSCRRWGGEEGVIKEMERREKDKFERGLQECQDVLGGGRGGGDDDSENDDVKLVVRRTVGSLEALSTGSSSSSKKRVLEDTVTDQHEQSVQVGADYSSSSVTTYKKTVVNNSANSSSREATAKKKKSGSAVSKKKGLLDSMKSCITGTGSSS